jgi:WD40 repeat protein
VSGAKDGGVKLWPAQATGKDEEWAAARLPIGFSSRSTRLTAWSRSNSVLLLNIDTGETEQEFQIASAGNGPGGFGPGGPRLSASPATVSTESKMLATIQSDGSVRVWNMETRESIQLGSPENFVRAIALSPDGNTLVAAGWGRGLRWWDVRQRTNTTTEADADWILFSNNGRTLATIARDGDVELWDVATRSVRAAFTVDPPPPQVGSGTPASFSPDGKLLAIACQDDAIRLWNVQTAQLAGTLTGHKQPVYTLAFAPDGKSLATASEDSTLKFWNVATQQELLTVRRLGGALRGLTFSPDGRALVAGTSSTLRTGGLRVFRAPTLREIDATEAHGK